MTTSDFRDRLENAVWRDRRPSLPAWKRTGLRMLRTLIVVLRDNTKGDLALRAMGLVYTTLLSLVPLLALSFSVLKAFGVHNQTRPLLQELLAPLGEQSGEMADLIITFIENMNVGVLGFVGLALLIYTAVSLVQKVEESFNFIWHIGQSRGFGERFSRYLTLLLVGPILIFSALGITASVMSADIVQQIIAIDPFGEIFMVLSRLTPYLLVAAAFSFAYYFIPNIAVRPGAALLGGLVAGIAWQTAGWSFAEFAASSRQYKAIYSGFAILILFLIWLYLSWRILLFGAGVAFYCQRPEYLRMRSGEPRLSNRMRERLAFELMAHVAGHFVSGKPPLSQDTLSRQLGVPEHVIHVILVTLEKAGLLARVGGTSKAYLPTRDLESVSLSDFLDIVRAAEEDGYLTPEGLPLQPRVRDVIQRIEEAQAAALAGASLADLAAHRSVAPVTERSPSDNEQSHRPV